MIRLLIHGEQVNKYQYYWDILEYDILKQLNL